MPSDMVLAMDVVVVKAVLRGTAVEVAFVLTSKQYAHWQYLIGERADESMLLDQNIVAEMQALLEHFK